MPPIMNIINFAMNMFSLQQVLSECTGADPEKKEGGGGGGGGGAELGIDLTWCP